MDMIIDPDLLAARRRRAMAAALPGADFLMQRAADDLGERLSTVQRRFSRAASLFSLTRHAADTIRESGRADEVVRVEAEPWLGTDAIAAEAPETLPLAPASLDLAVSLLTLHTVNDLPGMLVQIRRALRPDGLFLAAMAGAGTLTELREALLAAEAETSGGASPRVLPFADLRDVGALLQRAGFALPVADVETVTVRYSSMFGLMRDLRAMGATSPLAARSRRPATRRLFMRAAELYAERFADADGRVRATFQIVWMSGWAPHEDQQKPARRGSATMSLAEALKTGA